MLTWCMFSWVSLEEQNILYAPHRVYLHFIFHIAVDEASFREVETGDAKYGIIIFFLFHFLMEGEGEWANNVGAC